MSVEQIMPSENVQSEEEPEVEYNPNVPIYGAKITQLPESPVNTKTNEDQVISFTLTSNGQESWPKGTFLK